MTPEQKAAFVIAQAMDMHTRAIGMQARNDMEIAHGREPVYKEADFARLTENYSLGHNALIDFFRD